MVLFYELFLKYNNFQKPIFFFKEWSFAEPSCCIWLIQYNIIHINFCVPCRCMPNKRGSTVYVHCIRHRFPLHPHTQTHTLVTAIGTLLDEEKSSFMYSLLDVCHYNKYGLSLSLICSLWESFVEIIKPCLTKSILHKRIKLTGNSLDTYIHNDRMRMRCDMVLY